MSMESIMSKAATKRKPSNKAKDVEVEIEAEDNITGSIDDNHDFVQGFRDGWQNMVLDEDFPYQGRSGFRAGAALRRISARLMKEGMAAEDEDKAASE